MVVGGIISLYLAGHMVQVQCPHPSPRAPCAPRVSGSGRASVLTPSVATGEGSSVDTGTWVTNEIIVIVEGGVHISITGNRTQQAGA